MKNIFTKYNKLLGVLFSIEIQNFREYCILSEELFKQETEKFNEKIEEEAKKYSEEIRDEFLEANSDSYFQLKDIFPNMSRASLFTTCYSFIEYQLIRICNLLYKKYNYRIKLKDLRGDGIERARSYLIKVAGGLSQDGDYIIRPGNVKMKRPTQRAIYDIFYAVRIRVICYPDTPGKEAFQSH